MKERLTLYDIVELEHIDDYESVVCLRSNNYFNYDVSKFHTLLAKCVNLEELYFLNATNLSKCPVDLFDKLPALKTLVFNRAQWTVLPSEIALLQNLRHLALQSQELAQLPTSLSQLQSLEELDFNSVRLTNTAENLDELKEISTLKHLNLFRLKLKKLPQALPFLSQLNELLLPKGLYRKLLKTYPDFCAKIPYLYTHTQLEKKYANSLINICRKNHFDWHFRAVLFNLLAGNTAQLDQLASQQDILNTTDIKLLEVIRLKALEYLGLRWGKAAYPSLKKNAVVAVVGKLSINKNELKKKLKELDIKYSSKITNKTTHLLLGQLSHGAYNEAIEKKIPIISEQVILEFTNANTEQYLVDELDGNLQGVAHLSSLLLSGQDENVLLALTLFKQGGFPKELLTELFIVFKHSTHPEVLREAERLIRQYGSIALVDELKKGSTLFSKYTSEVGFIRKLKKLERTTEVDTLKIAWYSYQYYQRGTHFLLKTLASEQKINFLQQLIEKDHLKLSNLGLNSLPSEIFEFSNLKSLDLSYNYQLATISSTLIQKLTNLEEVNIRACYKISEKEGLLDKLKSEMPKVKFIY